jgi:hypothetical protein
VSQSPFYERLFEWRWANGGVMHPDSECGDALRLRLLVLRQQLQEQKQTIVPVQLVWHWLPHSGWLLLFRSGDAFYNAGIQVLPL